MGRGGISAMGGGGGEGRGGKRACARIALPSAAPLACLPRPPPRRPGDRELRSTNYSPRALAASSFLTSFFASAMALASGRAGATRERGVGGRVEAGAKESVKKSVDESVEETAEKGVDENRALSASLSLSYFRLMLEPFTPTLPLRNCS